MKPFKLLVFMKLLVFITLFWGSLASAQGATDATGPQLAVFPFASSEPRLGFAVADRLAHSFQNPSIPPELALGLVPPLLLQEATFVSPLNLLGDEGTGSRFAAAFLREALAVPTAVTGRVELTGEGLELTLFVARPEGTRSFVFTAPEAFPERLVRQAQQVLGVTGLTPNPDARTGIDLSSPYGTFVDGLIDLGSGFPAQAAPLLRRAGAALSAEPRWTRRAEAVTQLLSAQPGTALTRYPLLAAVVALNTQPFDEGKVARAFSAGTLPVTTLWRALLAAQAGDAAQARREFAAVGDRYPFAAAQALLYRLDKTEDAALKTDLQALVRQYPDTLSVLVSGLFLAQGLEDGRLEQTLATRLTELAPTFAYAYERLSQLAFDRDDPEAAATALRTATRLEPQSDLYWTNLGWAYYLLGALGASETASEEALALRPDETVALYNLGLVQVLLGRSGLALDTYARAAELDLQDDQLDPAAADDLRGALKRYPDVPDLHYLLGTLLEVSGRPGAAAAQFARFAEQGRGPLVADAEARVAALRAPAPPLRFTPGLQAGVGAEMQAVPAYLPGDLLYTRFELSTPGDALPTPLQVSLRLTDGGGNVVATSSTTERAPLPPNTVALEVTDAALTLPQTLGPGRYTLGVSVRVRGRTAKTSLPVTVSALPAPLARQLIGRGVTLRSLQTGQPLYTAILDDKALLATLLTELSRATSQAAETLPVVSSGRFAGEGGEAVFGSSNARDVRDFLNFMLQNANTDGVFAELYARWALAGAPVP